MDYSIFEKLIKIWSSPYLKSGLVQMLKKHFLTHNGLSWSSPYRKSGLVQMLKKHSKKI